MPGWVLNRLKSFSLVISDGAQKLQHEKNFCYLLRDKLHLSSKIHYNRDITIDNDTCIVATGKSGIKYIGRCNSMDPA